MDVNTQCIFYIICCEYHKGLPRLAVTRDGNSQRVTVCLGSQALFRRRVYCEPGKRRKAIASSFDMCALEYLTEGHTAPLTNACTTVICFLIVFVEKALLCTLGPLGAIVFLLPLLRGGFGLGAVFGLCVCLLGLLLLLGSCSTAAEKGGYQLYFASGLEDGSAILSEPYQGEADPGPRELMEALLSGPTEEELNSPFPSGVSLRSWGLEEGVLVLNLSEQYGGLTDISLTVADYCIVLTMSQLDGVEAVEINVAGQPVSYRNHQILTREEAVLSQPRQGQEAPNEGA